MNYDFLIAPNNSNIISTESSIWGGSIKKYDLESNLRKEMEKVII